MKQIITKKTLGGIASKIKSALNDFKKFALKGSVIDLAVGVIIGSAFTSVVNSLVNDIFMPIIGLLGGADFTGGVGSIKLNGDNYLNLGTFLGTLVNFLLVALCIYLVVKAVSMIETGARKMTGTEIVVKKPRICPYCKSELKEGATRCPYCTSQLPVEDEDKQA